MFRRFGLVAAALLFALPLLIAPPALAQNRIPTEEAVVSVDWNHLQVSVSALISAHQISVGEIDAFKRHLADMDAYLKACQDRPGCTTPVPAK